MTEPAPDTTGPTTAGDIAYETDAPNAYRWTTAAFDLLTAGRLHADVAERGGVVQASASGECPRCAHQFAYAQPLQAVVGESIRTLGGDDDTVQGLVSGRAFVGLTISCQCSERHPGRPQGVDHGCGINFRVEVRPEAAKP